MIIGEIPMKINVEFMVWVAPFAKYILYSSISWKIDPEWYVPYQNSRIRMAEDDFKTHKTPP